MHLAGKGQVICETNEAKSTKIYFIQITFKDKARITSVDKNEMSFGNFKFIVYYYYLHKPESFICCFSVVWLL